MASSSVNGVRPSLTDIAKQIYIEVCFRATTAYHGAVYLCFSRREFEDLLLGREIYYDIRTIRTKWKAFCAAGLFTVISGKEMIDIKAWNLRFPSLALGRGEVGGEGDAKSAPQEAGA